MAIQTIPTPKPKAHEVLIKVEAIGINRPDILQRKGHYPPPKGASPILGLEIAGTIVEVGPEVEKSALNRKVCALVPGGGYAEYCVTHYSSCLPIPKNFTPAEAASLPETFFTVWINVFDRAKLLPGETLLVQGGSGGIGSTAIQIAHALGNTVYTTAGSAEKCKKCEELGANRAINYKTEDFVAVIKELTGGKGVNVILDIIAGDYVAKELSILAEDGRLTFVGTMGGNTATISVREILQKRLTITGSSLRPRTFEYKGHIAKALLEHVWPFIDAGKIKPLIYKTFPFKDVVEAHKLMESGEHFGKIVLAL
jgi:NADPH2:quinone reductase